MRGVTFSEQGIVAMLVPWALLGLLASCQLEQAADSGASGGSSADSSGGQASVGGSGGSGAVGSGGAAGEIDWGGCSYDPGLEANIRWQLGSSSQYMSVRDLTYLTVSQEPYASLAGIECLENLEWVMLSYYFPEGERPTIDLSPLASLPKLTELRLTTIGVSHLEALADGPLRTLDLSWGEVDSIEALRGFAELENLELSGLELSDLSPLSDLASLRSLTLNTIPVSTLEPLSGLPALENLTLWYLDIPDLQGLVALPKLATLGLIATGLESFEGIADVPNLVTIQVDGCDQLASFDGLEVCEGLERIEVRPLTSSPTIVSDISALAEVSTLKVLDLAEANVSDIGALSGCPELESLNLRANHVVDLNPLAGLPLQWLDVSNNQVGAIDALADMPLSTLRISQNPISSLDPLGTLDELEVLAIDGLGASSLEPLRGAPITHLYAADNAISDIGPVMDWELVDLFLTSNEIVTLPDGFVGSQGFCARTDLTGNPLGEAAQDRLDALCAGPRTGEGYAWDGGSCSAVCETP